MKPGIVHKSHHPFIVAVGALAEHKNHLSIFAKKAILIRIRTASIDVLGAVFRRKFGIAWKLAIREPVSIFAPIRDPRVQ